MWRRKADGGPRVEGGEGWVVDLVGGGGGAGAVILC